MFDQIPARQLLATLFLGCLLALPGVAEEHDPWSRLLETYVEESADGVNRVDYAALAGSPADLAALDSYIASFETRDLSGTREADFAAWANLYNAVTVRYITQEYPLESIRDGYVFGGPWKKITVIAGGREVSLDMIEHDILRPRFQDPRVHYAINCASFGCPNLLTRAWMADTLDADLDAAARAYINHPRGVSAETRGLTVSSIYKWFEADFGGSKDDVIKHLLKYADPALAAKIRATPKIRDYGYDWSLNDTRTDPAQ
jgi:Protein of unknown function, DUF547